MPYGESTPPEVERIAKITVDAIFKVHSELGAGLLESIYETCLEYELKKRGLRVRRQVMLPVFYDGVRLDAGLRIDLIVEDCLIVEVKSVERMNAVFEAQTLTYLKLTRLALALLVNFNVALDGIRRIVLSQQFSRCAEPDE